jgi:hypothetical protein
MDERLIQRAIERILMDERVTEELEDAEADLLLQWGEQQVSWLADQHADEQAFEEATNQLRQIMRQINSFIGLRDDMDAAEQRETLTGIVTGAQALGYAMTEQMADDFLLLPADDRSESIQKLMGLITSVPTTDTDTDNTLDDTLWIL